jgi:hypothetical protein
MLKVGEEWWWLQLECAKIHLLWRMVEAFCIVGQIIEEAIKQCNTAQFFFSFLDIYQNEDLLC